MHLFKNDSPSYNERDHKVQQLKLLIDSKITRLQNPINCSSAKKFVCNVDYKGGLGYIFQHYSYCFIAALRLNRTLIFTPSTQSFLTFYIKIFFRPLSHTCVDSDGDNSTTWDGMEVTIDKTVDYQVIDFWFGRSKYLTLHAWIPTQISTELTSLSTQPFVLFMGFLLQYLMRPSE
ncbi:unnamed protein product, partial [Oppiella nova]